MLRQYLFLRSATLILQCKEIQEEKILKREVRSGVKMSKLCLSWGCVGVQFLIGVQRDVCY